MCGKESLTSDDGVRVNVSNPPSMGPGPHVLTVLDIVDQSGNHAAQTVLRASSRGVKDGWECSEN